MKSSTELANPVIPPTEFANPSSMFAKILQDLANYKPPANFDRVAYAGNQLDEGTLEGKIDASLREAGIVYLQIPSKGLSLALAVEEFPALIRAKDGALISIAIDRLGFVSDAWLTHQDKNVDELPK